MANQIEAARAALFFFQARAERREQIQDNLLNRGRRPDRLRETAPGAIRHRSAIGRDRLGRQSQRLVQAQQHIGPIARGQRVARNAPHEADRCQPHAPQLNRNLIRDAQRPHRQWIERAGQFLD